MVEASESKQAAMKIETDNLSQLVARILNQLAVSAWLPSAALVLMIAFVFRLARVVDQARGKLEPFDVIGQAFGNLSHTSWGGIVLMLGAIVVLTMLTQAFTFESIRVLEGYWGTNRVVEQLARVRCAYFRWVRKRLKKRLDKFTAQAWEPAELHIRAEQTDPSLMSKLTHNMILALRSRVLNQTGAPALTSEESAAIDEYDWREHAPPEKLRRMANLEKKLEDFPDAANIQATKLGNVLRHYEDETEVDTVESLVEEVFDRLPFSLQVAHDEQRGRLDLYCSMTFVWIFVAAVGVVRFGWHDTRHLSYGVAAAILGVIGAWFTYRAAVASARYYGVLLLQIAALREQEEAEAASEEVPQRTLRNLFGLLERSA